MSPAIRRGVITWFAKALLGMPLGGILLFGVAGTALWPWGWVFYVLGLLAVFSHGLVLLRVNPALLAERSKSLREQGAPTWDRVLVVLGAGILPYVSWIVSALDFRFGWSGDIPLAVRLAAVTAWVLAWVWILWATVANRFFTTTVRIQPGHHVQTGGPYRYCMALRRRCAGKANASQPSGQRAGRCNKSGRQPLGVLRLLPDGARVDSALCL